MPSILAGIVKNRGDRNCISLHFNGGLDAYRDNLHIRYAGKLFQNGGLACAVHQGQFVGEAFFLSDCNYAVFFFLCLVHYFDGCFTLHLIVTTRTLGQTSAVRIRIITFFRDG